MPRCAQRRWVGYRCRIPQTGHMRILVTGATGYIGGRLVPRLLDAGHSVRCLARHPDRLRDVPWRSAIEVASGDLMSMDGLAEACAGMDAAYYLVHSLGMGGDFEQRDRQAAANFVAAARTSEVRRLVYLGGLAPEGEELSPHMRSRTQVANELLNSGIPTIVLRAAVILGSGSASFEMLRYLAERLPAMVTPRWVRNHIQPIAVRDVLRYLVASVEFPADMNRAFDIGGPETVTYEQMIQDYARVSGLRRRVIVPTPVLSPALSSHWVGLVTPVPSAIARPLVESLRHEAVCTEHDIAKYVPDPPEGLIGVTKAIELALRRIRDASVETRWSSASWPGAASDPLPSDPSWAGGSLYADERSAEVRASAARLWRVIESIGGENGWYSWPLGWAIRGWIDRLVGGVGLRRGRRDRNRLQVGETLDFWRVEEIDPERLLRLRAEMKLPGLAWLELRVEPINASRCRFTQRALFHPHGLAGHAYWRAISPFHGLVFGGMCRNISHAAEGEVVRA